MRRFSGPSRTPLRSAVDDPTAGGLAEIALSHIDYRIKDETLKAKLTPDYPFGCKRTLVCSDFYKAVLRDNVDVVTGPSTT